MGALTARPHEVHLRLSEEEYRVLERNRAKCRLSQQTYLRKMCLNEKPKEHPPVEFFQLLNILDKIKDELYRIAVIAEKIGQIDQAMYWQNIKKLDNQISDLFRQFY
ncbi:MAG: hypothetical protein IJM83_02325 [Firmicutes bacterium]|nr:hypothetical protein [Bacillota bacterium]MBQ7058127.1 hypothetical protein [Bacillota bacterium]